MEDDNPELVYAFSDLCNHVFFIDISFKRLREGRIVSPNKSKYFRWSMMVPFFQSVPILATHRIPD